MEWPGDDQEELLSSEAIKYDGSSRQVGSSGQGNFVFDSSQKISNLSKFYMREEERYNGNEEDKVEHKLRTFNKSYEKNGLEITERPKAF